MILIGNFLASVIRITFCGSSAKTNPDSFGTANSCHVSGKHVLVAFLGSLLKLKINGSEETGSKLKTSSFFDDRDIFFE